MKDIKKIINLDHNLERFTDSDVFVVDKDASDRKEAMKIFNLEEEKGEE